MPTIRKSSQYGEFTLFYHTSSPFSNFHYCNFKLTTPDGLEHDFTSSEQYFMYIKAVTFKDKDIAAKILAETDPATAKKLGREVKGFDEQKWTDISKEVMETALRAKFTQNPELRYSLLVTQGSQLVECSPRDRLWGIGLSANNLHAVNPSKWRGANQLGKLLDKVRDEILQLGTSMADRIKIDVELTKLPQYAFKYFASMATSSKKLSTSAFATAKRANTTVPRVHNNNMKKPLITCMRNRTE